MCGIAGFAGLTRSESEQKKILGAIAHRGPDGSGVYTNLNVTLFHTRLKIIDLSPGGFQPMEDKATGVTMVFNGEIYNYRELKSTVRDTQYRGSSDTEVVLKLYLQEGIQCIEKLRGMFAIAIWDPRSKTLHLARDRFGIKPLHYYVKGSSIYFGSEMKAIMAMGVPIELNLNAVRDYLQDGLVTHTTETFFKPIDMLEPGTVLTLKDGRVTKAPFWEPYTNHAPHSGSGKTEEELWELLEESVRLHLISDVPVGISLSSGLDSQFIVHLLARIGKNPFHTFTFGFHESQYDEVKRVEETKFPLPLTQHFYRMPAQEMIPSLEQAMRYFEVPLGGLGTLSAYCLMKVAHQAGLKVLLSGEGADEIFGGYKYYYDAYFRELFDAGNTALLEKELSAYTKLTGEVLQIGDPKFEARVLGRGIKMRAPDGTELGGSAFLGPKLSQLKAPNELSLPRTAKHLGSLRQAMLRDLVSLKIPKLLLFQDRASMSSSIEMRVPFLDHKLFEYMANLSSDWLIRDGVAKYLPKRLLKRFANLDYLSTTKHFVATPQREWIKQDLKPEILKYLDEGKLRHSGLMDYDAWRKEYLRYSESKELGNSFFVWKVLNLEAMLRNFFPNGI